MNFTTFFIVLGVLILTNLTYVMYLSMYFMETVKLKKKYKQLFKKLCKEERIMIETEKAAASQEMSDSLNM